MVDKMTETEARHLLDAYGINDKEKRDYIMGYIDSRPKYEVVEMVIHLSRGRDIKWIEEVIEYEKRLRNRCQEDIGYER